MCLVTSVHKEAWYCENGLEKRDCVRESVVIG